MKKYLKYLLLSGLYILSVGFISVTSQIILERTDVDTVILRLNTTFQKLGINVNVPVASLDVMGSQSLPQKTMRLRDNISSNTTDFYYKTLGSLNHLYIEPSDKEISIGNGSLGGQYKLGIGEIDPTANLHITESQGTDMVWFEDITSSNKVAKIVYTNGATTPHFNFLTSPGSEMFLGVGPSTKVLGINATVGNSKWVITNAFNIIPDTDNTYDIGSSTKGIHDIYASHDVNVSHNANITQDVILSTNSNITFTGRILANLAAPAAGTITYCTDCLSGSVPCTSIGGIGAIAKRIGGLWHCD